VHDHGRPAREPAVPYHADRLVVMMPAVVVVTMVMVPMVTPFVVAVPTAIVPSIVTVVVAVPAAMVPLARVDRGDEPLLRGGGADGRCRNRRRAGAQAARTEHHETGGRCE
jgi:hypothetical protein